jgi:peroxiredoxin Q/BCP
MLAVGSEAPDFTLPDEQGTMVTLSSFRGSQPVVLIFYPRDETPGCTKQLCGIRDTYQAFEQDGAVVFGVNPSSEARHKEFAQRHNFPFRLLVDSDRSVAHNYKSLMLSLGPIAIVNRTVYVVGKDGKILFAERGAPSTETILAALHEGEAG